MRIDVCSRTEALRLAAEAEETLSIISIVSKGDPDVVFPDNPHIVSVLHLKFNDLAEEYDEEGIPYGRPLPSREDFAGLREFAAGIRTDRLIVHCREGLSRSAAVAQAVSEFLGPGALLFARHGLASANPLVRKLARRELGL